MEIHKAKGQIVKSYAGRDKGRFFVVLSTDDKFALIADGKVRKIEAPKKKKWMHLKPTKTIVQIPEGVTNRQLRKILLPFNNVNGSDVNQPEQTPKSPNEEV